MKAQYYLYINFLILAVLLTGCPEPPEFNVVPIIRFENVTFYNSTATNPAGSDTLTVSIYFQDGDGNLGLSQNDTETPYHPFDFVLDNEGRPVTYADVNRNPPFNPIDYLHDTVYVWRGMEIRDTFLIERNENFYNIFIDFYVKRQGEWRFFDTEAAPYYTTFNGRYPRLNSESYKRPLEGILNYKMNSAGFRPLFREDSMRLQVRIKDRDLNESNTIETPAFTLRGITVN